MRRFLSTSTDLAWERLAQADPYRAVLTTVRNHTEFFRSGEEHVGDLLTHIRDRIAPQFAPERILDFGCGVGRTLLPFAGVASEVVGVDVSPTMLKEASHNCARHQNVSLLPGLDDVSGRFDVIHSYQVFQHIPVRRGMRLLRQLVELLQVGGVMAIHIAHGRRAAFYRRAVHRARALVPGVNAVVNCYKADRPMRQ